MIVLKQHPLSAAFPAMSSDDFQSLKDSIENIGVQNPITLYEGMVIDGWHRYTAANDLGMPCPTVELGDVDPREFVLAQNKSRRHITSAQLAAATTAVYAWRSNGENQHTEKRVATEWPQTKTNAELAEIAGVSIATIKQAKAVQTSAAPEVVAAVKSGAIGLPKAAAIAKLPKEEQAAAIDKPLAAIKPAKTAAQEAAAQVAEDAYGDSDPVALLEKTEKQNVALQKQLDALLIDNTKAELHKMMLLRDHAVRRQNELMGMVNVREKELRRLANWLRRVGNAVGEDDPSKIAAIVEAKFRVQKSDACDLPCTDDARTYQ